MSLPDVLAGLVYVGVLWIPGGLIGLAAGIRGWTLAAAAPLLTYTIAGLAGPWLSAIGVSWSPVSAAVIVVAAAALVAGLRWVVNRGGRKRPADSGGWTMQAHLAVAACLIAATVVGAAAILGGIHTVAAIPQDWDAVFHANGIRWIAETGDGGLFAMSQFNWYENGGIPYPNAYHLVGAIVYRLTNADIPTVLNVHTILIPGLVALGLVALIRRMGGRAVLAGATALVVAGASGIYDMLWRGPLLPYATGVALTPVVVVLGIDFLDAVGWRAKIMPGLLFVLGLVGLICLHPAMLFGAVVFLVPPLVARWWRRPGLLRAEPAALLVAAVMVVGLAYVQLIGAARSAANFPAVDWPADLTVAGAVRNVVSFGHGGGGPQWLLAGAVLVGVLRYQRLRGLRWIGVVAAVFAALFVISAASDADWANSITRPWWNDRWRIIALVAITLCVIAGHGLAELQRLLASALTRVRTHAGSESRVGVLRSAAAALAVLLAFAVASGGLYLPRNQARMSNNTGEGPAVSHWEIAGMQALQNIVPPGTRVLNDRNDGSAWMYALAGVKPVAGHYDGSLIGPDALLLAERFNAYTSDPAVQAAVTRLHVGYVMLDRGFLRGDAVTRQPGLTNLDAASWLEKVYENPDVVIYKIKPPATKDGSTASTSPVKR